MKKLTNTKIPSCTKTKCQCSAGCILRPKIWVTASILYYVQSYEVQSLLYSPSRAARCSVCCILRPKLLGAETIVFSVQNYEMPSQLYSPYFPSKNMSYRVSCILRPKIWATELAVFSVQNYEVRVSFILGPELWGAVRLFFRPKICAEWSVS
jgi:hypothetical protein